MTGPWYNHCTQATPGYASREFLAQVGGRLLAQLVLVGALIGGVVLVPKLSAPKMERDHVMPTHESINHHVREQEHSDAATQGEHANHAGPPPIAASFLLRPAGDGAFVHDAGT